MDNECFNVVPSIEYSVFLAYSLLRGEPAPAARTARQPRPLCGGATGTVTRCATPAGSTTNSTTWVLRVANTESDSEVLKWADSSYRLKRGWEWDRGRKAGFPCQTEPVDRFLFRLIQLCFKGGRYSQEGRQGGSAIQDTASVICYQFGVVWN